MKGEEGGGAYVGSVHETAGYLQHSSIALHTVCQSTMFNGQDQKLCLYCHQTSLNITGVLQHGT